MTQHDCDDFALGASNVLNSTAVGGDDLGLSGYVQDNFEFLDQMDFSVMDHMDQCASYQVCALFSLHVEFERALTTFYLGWKAAG